MCLGFTINVMMAEIISTKRATTLRVLAKNGDGASMMIGIAKITMVVATFIAFKMK